MTPGESQHVEATQFAAETRAAGLHLSAEERARLFQVWQENLSRRQALRDESLAPDEVPFAGLGAAPARPAQDARGTC